MSRRNVLRSATTLAIASVVIPTAATPVAAGSHSIAVDLLAGQDEWVGIVEVTPDGDDLIITYDTSGSDWELYETHLHVADEFDDLPTNRPGNPKVGRFEFSGEPDPAPADIAEYTVDVSGMSGEVFIAAHAVVQLVDTIEEAPYGPIEVIDTRQAWRFDGTPVRSQRSNPDTVLSREFGQDESNFYSLGYGGTLNDEGDAVETFFGEHFENKQKDPDNPEDVVADIKAMEDDIDASLKAMLSDTENNAGWIIVRFDPAVLNVMDESDVLLVEDTWGLPYPLELVAVFARLASDDDWTFLCLGHNQEPDEDHDIHTVTECKLGELDEAVYFLIQDVTDPEWFDGLYPAQSATLDGYDLNVIDALNDHVELQEETAWGDGDRFVSRGNWATYFDYDLES